ncbi:unnamed protein product [Toxocara canis]|uniref:ShKT domain-containing protein n=1 Tax=Toxocara canis TaxID=6265 RepID=A0A183UE47_TOXCA|nr:unnamed protein product [Toxocara canis]
MKGLFSVVNVLQNIATLGPVSSLFLKQTFVAPATALSTCEDYDVDCGHWVALAAGYCDEWLRATCEVSCKVCRAKPSDRVPAHSVLKDVLQPICVDGHVHCAKWMRTGECTVNPAFMHVQCCSSCSTKPMFAS